MNVGQHLGHGTDVPPEAEAWIGPLVQVSWTGHDVFFPDHERTLSGRYCSLTGEHMHAVVSERLGQAPHGELILGRRATAVDARGATLDDGRRLEADLVVDCTGNPEGLALATKLVRPRGTLVLKTTTHDLGTLSPIPWILDEITLVGSRCGPFAPALRMLASGTVDPTDLISAEYALDDGLAALDRAARRDTVKVLLRP